LGHELVVTLPPGPVIVDADPTRLSQVLMNLLNNAAKYTERGGRIELRVELAGSDLVVSVKDTGIGIPPDKLQTIFEMFAQVDGALSRSQGGLGIGLNLAKRLVEMHGGTIEAKSGQEDDKRQALEAGFDHHLTKPVNPAQLEALIAALTPVGERT
jgi:signal transduction histidine kinase